MINEEKVIMMTKMASYEANQGKKNVSILNYFRSDYIGIQLLGSIISATICALLVFGIYILYDFENVMLDIYKVDLFEYGRHMLTRYLIFVGIYTLITYIVYAYRYSKAQNGLRVYLMNLKKLGSMYGNKNTNKD